MKIQIKRTNENFNDIELPKYATSGSAGMDIYAALDKELTLLPGQTELIPTGIAIAVPKGYECQVRSRSGLAAKHGVFALNAPGTVDSDYRGEIRVILSNFGKSEYIINRGDRIAQIVINKVETAEWELTDELPETDRGEGGFGSTGVSS
jgi:dUTP pyrophosphatase